MRRHQLGRSQSECSLFVTQLFALCLFSKVAILRIWRLRVEKNWGFSRGCSWIQNHTFEQILTQFDPYPVNFSTLLWFSLSYLIHKSIALTLLIPFVIHKIPPFWFQLSWPFSPLQILISNLTADFENYLEILCFFGSKNNLIFQCEPLWLIGKAFDSHAGLV